MKQAIFNDSLGRPLVKPTAFLGTYSLLHSEAVLWRNSPPNKYYDYYYSVNGHEWVEWGIQVNLWNMGVFLQLVWKRRNWPKLVNYAHEKCHGMSFCICCSWIFDLGMDCIRHLVVRFLNYITQSRHKNKNIGCGVGSSACQECSIYCSHGTIHIHTPIIRWWR